MPEPTITAEDRAAAEEYLPQVREEREVVTVSGDQYRPPDIHTSYIWVRSGINHEYHSKEEAEADRKSDVEELAAIIAKHREQREKVLVEATQRLVQTVESNANSMYRKNFGSDHPSVGEATRHARQALKEAGYEQEKEEA